VITDPERVGARRSGSQVTRLRQDGRRQARIHDAIEDAESKSALTQRPIAADKERHAVSSGKPLPVGRGC
jgi:hypothetical protein